MSYKNNKYQLQHGMENLYCLMDLTLCRGEWPSGLRRCDQNRKVPGSNPTRRSAGLRDPTSLRGSR